MGCLHRLAVLGLLAVAAACSPAPGTFSVRFEWRAMRPEPGSHRVIGEVRTADGRIIPAEPAIYQSNMRLAFDGVPYGDGLRVEVRFVSVGGTDDAPPRYFGRSAPFSLRRGQATDVAIEIPLSDAPAIMNETPIELVGVQGALTNRSDLQLRVTARGVDQIQIAQDLSFFQGLETFEATTTLESATATSAPSYLLTYDINESLAACSVELGGDPSDCEGRRTLFVRGLREGLFSPTVPVEITLDTRSPQVALASVQYAPSMDNPIVGPSAATVGSSIFVAVSFDEALNVDGGLPEMTARNGDSVLLFRLSEGVESSLTFSATVDSSTYADGIYTPEIRVADLAGNITDAATFSTPEIRVDTTPPTLVIDQANVSHLRLPSKSSSARPLGPNFAIPPGPSYFGIAPADPLSGEETLPGTAFTIQEGLPPLIRFWAEEAKATLLGAVRPTADNTWSRLDLQLVDRDSSQVFVTAFDSAGNEAPPVVIENNWIIASSDDATHRVSQSGLPNAPLEPAFLNFEPEVNAVDANVILQEAERGWHELEGLEPAGLHASEAVYDDARGQMVLVMLDFVFNMGTWLRRGNSWHRLDIQNPVGRRDLGIAYDRRRGRTVMFGGARVDSVRLDDTWEFDGSEWVRLQPALSPSARSQTAMVYDEARRQTVLFGGTTNAGASDETWAWDGVTWTLLEPQTRPPPMAGHKVTYDRGRDRVLLVGLGETWAWDGTTWAQIAAGPAPTWSGQAALEYDVPRNRLLLVADGGQGIETWAYDGNVWAEQNVPSLPDAQALGLAFAPPTGRTLLVGTSGTFEWDGAGWSDVSCLGTVTPPPTLNGAMTFDAARNNVVFLPSGSSATYLFDGGHWVTGTGSFGARDGQAITYDSNRSLVVTFGGFVPSPTVYFDDTHEWNGVNWDFRFFVNRPSPRRDAAFAHDSLRGETVMFGGTSSTGECLEDMWRYDGTDWTPAAPPPLGEFGPFCPHPVLLYDANRDRLALFAGHNGFNHWEWDGSTWTDLSSTAPQSIINEVAVFDTRRGTVVFYESLQVEQPTWEWDGSAWTPIGNSNAPPARNITHLSYDAARDALLLFGGLAEPGIFMNDTWIGRGPTSASVQYAAQLPGDVSAGRLSRVEVTAHCAGSFEGGDGAALLAWEQDRWRSLATHQTGQITAAGDGRLDLVVTGTEAAALLGPENRLFFQCRPNGVSGLGVARVAFDHAEARVRYQSTER